MPVPSRLLLRLATGAVGGACAGAALLAAAFNLHPDLTFEMDRDLPAIASGFYPAERAQQETFAWTSARARVRPSGIDRDRPWRCAIRVRGGRAEGIPQPEVAAGVDGVILARQTVTNDYQDLEIVVPAAPNRLFTLTIDSSSTFVPGPSDRRELGVQIDRLSCRPAEAGPVLPSPRALTAAAVGAGLFGCAFALVGFGLPATLAAAVLVAAGSAWPLSIGPAPYTPYADRLPWLAFWMSLALVSAVKAIEGLRRAPLDAPARFAVAFSAAVLFVKAAGLIHPSKLIVDAVFHAHRLEGVLAGGYYFTQPLGPSGVQFPYAIALYVFAAPWSVLTRDYVTLLRIVVLASEALAGALLYLMIVRAWGDKLIAAAAVVGFHLVPLPYAVIGNANLTNAFGQIAALVAIVAATTWRLEPRRIAPLAALTALISVALLAHVGTFGLLVFILTCAAVVYRWLGGPSLSGPSRSILVATAAAALLSVAVYYAHFGEAYRSLGRARGDAAVTAPADSGAVAAPSLSAPSPVPTPLPMRGVKALALIVTDIGWPILILAGAGLWRLWKRGGRDRLVFILAAWGMTEVLFVAAGVAVPLSTQYVRYAAEFVGRADLATYPAVVILAAVGFAWAWRSRTGVRLGSIALAVWAVMGAVRQWAGWLE